MPLDESLRTAHREIGEVVLGHGDHERADVDRERQLGDEGDMVRVEVGPSMARRVVHAHNDYNSIGAGQDRWVRLKLPGQFSGRGTGKALAMKFQHPRRGGLDEQLIQFAASDPTVAHETNLNLRFNTGFSGGGMK